MRSEVVIQAEGVFLWGGKRASSIIHAEGVRGWCSVIPRQSRVRRL